MERSFGSRARWRRWRVWRIGRWRSGACGGCGVDCAEDWAVMLSFGGVGNCCNLWETHPPREFRSYVQMFITGELARRATQCIIPIRVLDVDFVGRNTNDWTFSDSNFCSSLSKISSFPSIKDESLPNRLSSLLNMITIIYMQEFGKSLP